jgi:hypothetical protein
MLASMQNQVKMREGADRTASNRSFAESRRFGGEGNSPEYISGQWPPPVELASAKLFRRAKVIG